MLGNQFSYRKALIKQETMMLQFSAKHLGEALKDRHSNKKFLRYLKVHIMGHLRVLGTF